MARTYCLKIQNELLLIKNKLICDADGLLAGHERRPKADGLDV